MVIDILAVVAIIVFGIWGARRGLLKQVAAVAAILLMYFFASPLADILCNIICDHSELSFPPRYLHVLLVAVSATAIFVIVTLIGGFLHRTLVTGIKPVETANRAFGFTLGMVLAATVIYFILCLANCGMGWIEGYAPSLGAEIQKSTAFGITKEFNIIEERMPDLAKKTGKPAQTTDEANPDAATPAEPTLNTDDPKHVVMPVQIPGLLQRDTNESNANEAPTNTEDDAKQRPHHQLSPEQIQKLLRANDAQ